jgi:hypothetical protein
VQELRVRHDEVQRKVVIEQKTTMDAAERICRADVIGQSAGAVVRKETMVVLLVRT